MSRKRIDDEIEIPAASDWRTTDEDEINRRRKRALEESFHIRNRDPRHPIFSNFDVRSASGLTYQIEIRDLANRQFSCTCADFRKNGLGTCKHTEAVLLNLAGRFGRRFRAAAHLGSPRVEVGLDFAADTLRVHNGVAQLPKSIRSWFDTEGRLMDRPIDGALAALQGLASGDLPHLRVSQEVEPWLQSRSRIEEAKVLRRLYEQNVQKGIWPAQETKSPLFPYQREGMLHLAFKERALLADEMGLGKTIQAIAACALLHRLERAQRVLVVTPASLKTEWEEQIQRFTDLPCRLAFGGSVARRQVYQEGAFFTVTNYEQIVRDAGDIMSILKPDIVVLDEAQRIKNWSTLTAQAVKRLESRYAFVLTGTPIENRIDEIYSLMDFLDPRVLGPLFRFNRDFYEMDERGRPLNFRNLAQLHERIRPLMLRRRKSEVETELPERTDRQFFVKLTPNQQKVYDDYFAVVARLAARAATRGLTKEESERLLIHLAMMRMVCDTTFILDPKLRDCPKLAELEKILEECSQNPGVKVIIFSEWEKMLQLVRGVCQKLKLGFAWHTGSVPQQKRRSEINAFKNDPECRVFLSTDAGSTGLNLQNASVVVNCDLPWNPAKLEQRIARAWRKNQTRPVTVINLVAENTIEHRMLETLSQKQALADGVLELKGDLSLVSPRGGRDSFLKRLQQLVAQPVPGAPVVVPEPAPADPLLAFSAEAAQATGSQIISCEERFPSQGTHTVLYVVVEGIAAAAQSSLTALYENRVKQFAPHAATQLQIVDRATHETIERLIEAGLITRSTRAVRPLYPKGDPGPPPLSVEEMERSRVQRELAKRKIKMAQLLGAGDLVAEALESIRAGTLALARSFAIDHRLPEPSSFEDALTPPWIAHFGTHSDSFVSCMKSEDTVWATYSKACALLRQILGD